MWSRFLGIWARLRFHLADSGFDSQESNIMATRVFSRRDLLRVGLAGAAVAAAPAGTLASSESLVPVLETPATGATAQAREPLATLSAAESDPLEAIVARLIPSDASGPGAAEARAGRYIDRALGGALASSRQTYAAGLAAVQQYARTSKGASFVGLSPADQDAVLTDLESNAATGFTPNSAAFFDLVRNHAIQGMFCDPYYGGNANFCGWDLLGYPGVRTVVTADQQRVGIELAPNHKSAYDYDMFLKASSRPSSRGGMTNGD
jgi:gluconate 2-dehydrogenase gamma chain